MSTTGLLATAGLMLYAASPSFAQPAPSAHYTGPIFDAHLHTDPPASAVAMPNPVTGSPAVRSHEQLRDATIRECNKYNITGAVLNGWPKSLQAWSSVDRQRFLPAPMPLETNATPIFTVDQLRQMKAEGRASVLGEIMGQYVGLNPADPVLEPYWAAAEQLDIPVMIHTGTSFPDTAASGYPAFRLRYGNPLLLEDVLVRHPKLRLWIAHGGMPWTEETIALMQQYPRVYMDISTIDWIFGQQGRPAFYAFLQAAINQGFGKRILFGTDQMGWPDAIGLAVRNVDEAPFLSPQQKADIFYNNAATFFRLK